MDTHREHAEDQRISGLKWLQGIKHKVLYSTLKLPAHPKGCLPTTKFGIYSMTAGNHKSIRYQKSMHAEIFKAVSTTNVTHIL